MGSCDIVMPVWNSLEVTKECIESIKRSTRYPYRLIIIDNASDRPVGDYLDGVEAGRGVRVIRNRGNEGFVKAVNQGLRVSTAEYVCLMNNDTIATEGWLEEMANVAELEARIGMVNPSSNNLGQEKGRHTLEEFARMLKENKGRYIGMGACVGFCMLIKRQVIEAAGEFDEIYGRGNFEETDYCRKAQSKGYICVRAKGAYVHHRIKSSFAKLGDYESSFRRNQEIFNKRWGRPRRLLYILTKSRAFSSAWAEREVTARADRGDWIWFFYPDAACLPDVKEHSNIKFVRIPRRFFEWSCLFRILKKKKGFDSIYSDDPGLSDRIGRFGAFHKAENILLEEI